MLAYEYGLQNFQLSYGNSSRESNVWVFDMANMFHGDFKDRPATEFDSLKVAWVEVAHISGEDYDFILELSDRKLNTISEGTFAYMTAAGMGGTSILDDPQQAFSRPFLPQAKVQLRFFFVSGSQQVSGQWLPGYSSVIVDDVDVYMWNGSAYIHASALPTGLFTNTRLNGIQLRADAKQPWPELKKPQIRRSFLSIAQKSNYQPMLVFISDSISELMGAYKAINDVQPTELVLFVKRIKPKDEPPIELLLISTGGKATEPSQFNISLLPALSVQCQVCYDTNDFVIALNGHFASRRRRSAAVRFLIRVAAAMIVIATVEEWAIAKLLLEAAKLIRPLFDEARLPESAWRYYDPKTRLPLATGKTLQPVYATYHGQKPGGPMPSFQDALASFREKLATGIGAEQAKRAPQHPTMDQRLADEMRRLLLPTMQTMIGGVGPGLDGLAKHLGGKGQGEEFAVLLNAFAVGVWNSVVDFFGALVDLVILIGGAFDEAWRALLGIALGDDARDTPALNDLFKVLNAHFSAIGALFSTKNPALLCDCFNPYPFT